MHLTAEAPVPGPDTTNERAGTKSQVRGDQQALLFGSDRSHRAKFRA